MQPEAPAASRREPAFSLRPAQMADVPVLEALIARSGVGLSTGFYSDQQAAAVTRYVFGVDTQLIADQTYFIIEDGAKAVACGGWSKRRTLFGGDRAKSGPDPLLDPSQEAARIRAFFVDPGMERRGLGSQLMRHCTREAVLNGFGTLELVATLPGEPLYLAFGFAVIERFELDLPGGIQVPVTRMRKNIGSA